MTDQEAFDQVVSHLLTQNARSVKFAGKDLYGEDVFVCRYRGDNGLKCAIGALIPEDQYSDDMEGWLPRLLLVHFPSLPFAKVDRNLLYSLQKVHDLCGVGREIDIPRAKWQLRNVAKEHGLNLPDSLKE